MFHKLTVVIAAVGQYAVHVFVNLWGGAGKPGAGPEVNSRVEQFLVGSYPGLPCQS